MTETKTVTLSDGSEHTVTVFQCRFARLQEFEPRAMNYNARTFRDQTIYTHILLEHPTPTLYHGETEEDALAGMDADLTNV